MSSEEVVSYERQRPVNWIFILIVIILAVVSLWYQSTLDEFFRIMFLFIGAPLGFMMVSLIFGALSKRAIDYIPGEWQREKKWLNIAGYEKIAESHTNAYSHLIGDDESCGCCCTFFLLPIFGFLVIAFTYLSQPLISMDIDSILFFLFLVIISSTLGFLWGFKFPKIDEEEFFKPVLDDDAYEFVKALKDVNGLRVGVDTEIGRRGKAKALLDAKPKVLVEGLPDTVSIEVQVSHSGFAYPYLVGTIYKGSAVKEGTERYNLATRYPAMVERSMDDEVSVFVARFDIPKKSSGVPSISEDDFRELGALMVRILKENAS